MTDQELLYTIALTRLRHLNSLHLHLLLERAGDAQTLFENRSDIRQILPEATPALCRAISAMDTQLSSAEQEMKFAQEKHIECLGMDDAGYPARLRECPDAPILLYYLGETSLNARRIVSIVGTRQITEYGKDLCRTFVADLKRLCPDVLIVSGLAYGTDVHAHRNALQQGLPTVGVLAHGLDQIYPRLHRDTAIQMIHQGGLLTEYPSLTKIDKLNFLARNRIVAGIADATIVVESAQRGGSLITARIARDYNREVFAFPGRVTDTYSAGCNALIANTEAGAILGAEDFMLSMGWMTEQDQKSLKNKNAQLELFPELSEEEEKIVSALKNSDGKGINQISVETCTPIGELSSLLFTLEMKGLVKMMNGGMYRLL